jgi:hypothetical protein
MGFTFTANLIKYHMIILNYLFLSHFKLPHGMGDLYAAQVVCVSFHSSPGDGARAAPISQRPCSVTFQRHELNGGLINENKAF